MTSQDLFGDPIRFCEPYWYQGFPSAYYKDTHRRFRALCRDFVEKEVKPFADEWDVNGYPKDLHLKCYQWGIQGAVYPVEYGGTPPEDFDAFHELIMMDELARSGAGGVLGHLAINSMALPPIIHFGSQRLKDMVLRDVIEGRKFASLAISEPGYGSDVAGIETTAEKDETGRFYIINGQKKWITGGLWADFFTLAARTGGKGMKGLSLILVPRDTPGLSVRKMETQGSSAHNTTMVTLDDVRVPVENLIGQEGMGFKYIVHNFNHERLVIAVSACRMARLCYEEAMKYALVRKTFGKTLVQHQLVRFKLAEMARQIECLQDMVERVAYQFSSGVPDAKLGGQCALLKVQASKTFEFCSREASQIFGGSSIVKEGKGKIVERLSREVRAQAIPGGSEEILLDFTIRQAVAKAKRLNSKL